MKQIIIDVREVNEFAIGHVNGAVNVPLATISLENSKIASLPKDTKIIVYCNSGNRSGVAMKILQNLGYLDVANGINQKAIESK